MPDSPLSLLAILERHGITREVLEFWVHVLESRTNGSVTFHQNEQGYLTRCELRLVAQASAIDAQSRVTNVFTSSILRQNCRPS
jgi:hypothetical protein